MWHGGGGRYSTLTDPASGPRRSDPLLAGRTDTIVACYRPDGSRPSRRLVSCDVFDTLLLRTLRSERARLVIAERRFAKLLLRKGHRVAPDQLFDARVVAQKLAFRAIGIGQTGEVRFEEIVARQLRMLGLPVRHAAARLNIEIEVEKEALRANHLLARQLRDWRDEGFGIVATSDTMLPAWAVAELLQHFHGPGVVDRVYTSADLGVTKRDGSIFGEIAKREGVTLGDILHLGDDCRADVAAPRAVGCQVRHLGRARWRHHARQANGALATWPRAQQKAWRSTCATPRQFGREVFGPLVAELALMIWCYAAEASGDGTAVLLFCARGGLAIRECFERTIERLGLPLLMRRENLAVSRLVAARSAVLARSEAAAQELAREFRGAPMCDVAHSLGGGTYILGDEWRREFDPERFFELLFSPAGALVLEDMREQDRRFRRHLDILCAGATRLILCDTGLYGSTQRLLAAGMPERCWETIQLARSNYKGFCDEHFARVTGLAVERDGAPPGDPRSAILRYWQLVEAVFEPAISSVRSFSLDRNGAPVANCGAIGRGAVDLTHGHPILGGALDYLAGLRPSDGMHALRDARVAWRRLARAITRPRRQDLEILAIGDRSIDFGRTATVAGIVEPADGGTFARLKALRRQLWREGAIRSQFPMASHLILPLLDILHLTNAVRRAIVRRLRARPLARAG